MKRINCVAQLDRPFLHAKVKFVVGLVEGLLGLTLLHDRMKCSGDELDLYHVKFVIPLIFIPHAKDGSEPLPLITGTLMKRRTGTCPSGSPLWFGDSGKVIVNNRTLGTDAVNPVSCLP